MKTVFILSVLCFFSLAQTVQKEKDSGKPLTYCVFFHSPGPNWQQGVPFQEQPGVRDHVSYMRQLFEKQLMVMGGPFPDNSGGMMIYRGSDLEKARELAEADPAVKSGLLKVNVKLWLVPMSSVQFSEKEPEKP